MSKVDLSDVVILLGFLALEYGIATVSVSVAWIVGGLLFLCAGLLPLSRKAKR